MKTMTTNYSRFFDLLDIDITPRYDESIDGDCFEKLASVFWKHQKTDRFAVTLLHTHFEVRDEESLLEFVDHENQELVIRTIESASPEVQCAVATSWRLTHDEDLNVVPIAVQLASIESFESFGSYELSACDLKFMSEVASILMQAGKLNRFGLCFAKTDFSLEPNQCLLESTCRPDSLSISVLLLGIPMISVVTFRPVGCFIRLKASSMHGVAAKSPILLPAIPIAAPAARIRIPIAMTKRTKAQDTEWILAQSTMNPEEANKARMATPTSPSVLDVST